jgi:hypothetical protein
MEYGNFITSPATLEADQNRTPNDAFECGPCAEIEDGMWKVSFIAGGAKSDRQFKLYRMPGFDAEPMVQVAADVGFVWKDRVVHAGRRGPITIIEPGRMVTLALPGVEYLYRVSYDPFQPNRLLISGQFPGGEIFSWAYQPGMKKLYEVITDGVPAYKCAFYEGGCYYAKREAGFEERHIVKAESLELMSFRRKNTSSRRKNSPMPVPKIRSSNNGLQLSTAKRRGGHPTSPSTSVRPARKSMW